MSYDYSENILVQESAGHLLEDELGWRVELAYNTEVLGETGTFGRKSYKEILLVKYLKEALLKLNPWLTPALLEDAIKTFESHMSSASLMQINEENYRHIRDGIPVKVKKQNGQIEEKKAIVIDFTNPENNDFLAIRPLINDFLRKMAKFRHQENQDVSAGTRIRFFIDKPAAMISFPRAVIKYL